MSGSLAMIVACDRQRAIGAHGQMAWHLPDDLRRFKALTLGHSVLMGRKTFAAIGRALPGRRNWVLSRDPAFAAPGVTRVDSLDAAIAGTSPGEQLWVIGGGEVYALALDRVERLELTEVDTVVADADAWFPPLPPGRFRECARVHHATDATHAHAFDFVSYVLASNQPPA